MGAVYAFKLRAADPFHIKSPRPVIKSATNHGARFLLLVKFNLYNQIDLISHHRHCVT